MVHGAGVYDCVLTPIWCRRSIRGAVSLLITFSRSASSFLVTFCLCSKGTRARVSDPLRHDPPYRRGNTTSCHGSASRDLVPVCVCSHRLSPPSLMTTLTTSTMASRILPTLLALLISLRPAHAIQVTPGSPCAALCIDDPSSDPFSPSSSSTNASDIVCQDSLYSNSDEGEKFKSCLECLQKSEKTNGTEADNYWMLYNLRHTLGTCLYGFGDEDKVINSPCVIGWACGPLEDAILAGDLDAGDAQGDDALEYCSAGNGSLFGNTLKSCINCLKSSSDETYLGNCESFPLDYPFSHVSL